MAQREIIGELSVDQFKNLYNNIGNNNNKTHSYFY